ncbi:MAG: SDR family oxidoreductase [Trueperaceae bacterium]
MPHDRTEPDPTPDADTEAEARPDPPGAAGQAPRRVLVTGASSGIGRELALAFARRGDALILHGRDEERLRDAADAARTEATSRGHDLPAPVAIAGDLASPGGVDELLDRAETAGGVDVLVNNAGFGTYGRFDAPATAADDDLVQVNVVAAMRLAKALLPEMVQRNRGGVLNVASTAAFQPGPLSAAYYASKAYLLHLSEAIAVELRDTDVTVSALCPGPTRSAFHERAAMGPARLVRTPGLFLEAREVAEAGVRGFERGRRVVVPGVMNKIGAWSLPRLPRPITLAILRYANAPTES